MPARHLLLFGFATVLAVSACNRPALADPYTHDLTTARARKDDLLRSASDSPVPASARAALLPLPYYPPDSSYRVPASLVPDPNARIVEMLTSTGKRRQVEVLGTLQFVLQGRPLKLTAFAEEGSNDRRLFVPFTDTTSGGETYGAGRYIDLERATTGIYILDFNTAYNPYCAYNHDYDCPVPPSQNRLPVPVRAGERAPKSH
jgi:uncharacterized protein (DUF1684 family)